MILLSIAAAALFHLPSAAAVISTAPSSAPLVQAAPGVPTGPVAPMAPIAPIALGTGPGGSPLPGCITPAPVLICLPNTLGACDCPCCNDPVPPASSPLDGCIHSCGSGASITTGGNSCLLRDNLTFTATGMPAVSCLLIQGDTLISPPVFFGEGLRCTGGQLLRLFVAASPGPCGVGSVTFPPSSGPTISAQVLANTGSAIPAGATRWYFVIYRDMASICTGAPTWDSTPTWQVVWI